MIFLTRFANGGVRSELVVDPLLHEPIDQRPLGETEAGHPCTHAATDAHPLAGAPTS